MDHKSFIFKRVKEHHLHLKKQGYHVIATFLQGSQNYNLDLYTENYISDIDTKSIILPSLDEITSSVRPISKVVIMDNNEHAEIKDVRVMFEMFKRQNLSYLELLFTEYKIIDNQYRDLILEMLDINDEIANINQNQLLRCIKGMSAEKLKVLDHPYPTVMDKIKEYGYDPKQLHHILRLNDLIVQYTINKNIKSCFIPQNRDYLLEVKQGIYSLEEARKIASETNQNTHNIIDSLMLDEDFINDDTIKKLDQIKKNLIERSLLSELSNKEKQKKKTPSGKVFVTSDWHLGHSGKEPNEARSIIVMDNRPFETLEEMKQTLVNNWNTIINDNDEVYILGDLSFESPQKVNELLTNLKGIKHLIVGNHDEYLSSKKFDRTLFETITIASEVNYKGHKFVMSHYPMYVNDLPTRNIIALHGHTHKREMYHWNNTYNVGCMHYDYKPVNLDCFISKTKEQPRVN